MRKHGWQLPYHPLQVVAVAVFLALGFAYYVFFVPFVGKKLFQYIAIGIYTPLIVSAFSLYIWCAGSNPADPGVFKSKKYLKKLDKNNHAYLKETKLNGESASTIQDGNAKAAAGKNFAKSSNGGSNLGDSSSEINKEASSFSNPLCFLRSLALLPCTLICHCTNAEEASELSEDGMFYCSLCEVEVYKFSKHCRVCDKCVDRFDHHCRWLNNCIGRRNYRKFFTLMVSSILLLILQWSTGILVLICCFLERKSFSVDIASKLGSSFTVVPFVIVVAVCTLLAMIATLPLAQLFFFHILLIKKGISTYDYIIALREQEQQEMGVQQSPQMSPRSSLTGLSSASSFNAFQRAAWCTPPRLFVEDQFDVVPPVTGSVSSLGKKTAMEEPVKKKNSPAVKISPWTLARLNAEEVSKTAAEVRKRSKILQPVARRQAPYPLERESSFSSSSRRMSMRPDNNRKRPSQRIRLPADFPFEPVTNASSLAAGHIRDHMTSNTSSSLIPLQHEARSAFWSNLAMSTSTVVAASSPESSLDSTDIHPFRISSSGAEEGRRLVGLLSANLADLPLSRSTSDGYDASGGEDSDRIPNRIVQRSTNWSSLLFGSENKERATKLKTSTSSGQTSNRKS
ncbi:hypothetical protein Leryth_019726 [Lithospermum erythrorhizon]|nr:hypothetical protein Leryth_019726 [Lithospermum erythrorhizon]